MSKLSSSVLILVVTKMQVHTLENSQGSLSLVIFFITNCDECENQRKSPKNKVNTICNKVLKLRL